MSDNPQNTSIYPVAERLKQQYSALISSIEPQFGEDIVTFKPEARKDWFDICRFLHDGLGLDYLSFVTAIDRLSFSPPPAHKCRYEVVYQLYSVDAGTHLRVKLPVADGSKPSVVSVTPIWKGAEFLENETFDMFGIVFEGHPDLRRMYMPEDWEGHPLRKDYPLKGHRPRGDKYYR